MVKAELSKGKRTLCDVCGKKKQITKITLDSNDDGSYGCASFYICEDCLLDLVTEFILVQEDQEDDLNETL